VPRPKADRPRQLTQSPQRSVSRLAPARSKAAVREASREALRMKLGLRKLRAMVALVRLLLKPVVRNL